MLTFSLKMVYFPFVKGCVVLKTDKLIFIRFIIVWQRLFYMDWHVWLIIGVVLFIFEIFTPTMFFINLAVAAMITAIPAYYEADIIVQMICFSVLTVLSYMFLRPLLLGKIKSSQETGVKGKYIGAMAKTVTEVTATSGRIAVFGEEWDARTEGSDEVIHAEQKVTITANEGIIMFVKSLGE